MLVGFCAISMRLKKLKTVLHINLMVLAVLSLKMELNLPNIRVFKSHHINKNCITLNIEWVL